MTTTETGMRTEEQTRNGVRVKPLEWSKGKHTSTDDDGGKLDGLPVRLHAWKSSGYLIIQQRGKDGLYLLRGESKGAFPNLVNAQAAAQADFERRVLSCLDTLDGGETEAEPVAWEHRFRARAETHFAGGEWGPWQSGPAPELSTLSTYEVEDRPLYASPPVDSLKAEIERLQAFKDYTHKRLDEAGVPTHPDGEHSKAGCRIGDRMDIMADRASRPVEKMVEALREAKLQIEYLREKFTAPETGNATLAKIDAALASHQEARR